MPALPDKSYSMSNGNFEIKFLECLKRLHIHDGDIIVVELPHTSVPSIDRQSIVEDVKQMTDNLALDVGVIAITRGTRIGVLHKDYLPNKKYFSVREVAQYYGLGRQSIYNYIKSGELPVQKVAGSVRITREEVLRLGERSSLD